MSNNNKVLNQNLDDKAPEQQLLIAQLLFTEKPQQANPEKLQAALEKLVGTVNNISDNPEQPSYAVEAFKAEFKDSVPIPVLASFVGPYEFSAELDELTSSQFWNVPNGAELMNACKYSVSAFSMLSGGLHYKQQAELFLAQIEAALECYPDCKAIYVPHSGKLTLPSYFYEGRKYGMVQNFIRTAVNARFSASIIPRTWWWIHWVFMRLARQTCRCIFTEWCPIMSWDMSTISRITSFRASLP